MPHSRSSWRTLPWRPHASRRNPWVAVQPRRPDRRCGGLHDAADDDALGERVIVVIVPLAGHSLLN